MDAKTTQHSRIHIVGDTFPASNAVPSKTKNSETTNCRTNTGIRTEIGTMNSGFRGAFPLMRRQMKSVASYES